MATPLRHMAEHDLYGALLQLPEHLVGEIVDGDLHVSPRPSGRHVVAASTLIMDLGTPFGRGRGGPGGWWILDEPEIHFGPHVTVPDVAGWTRKRMPALPDSHVFTVPPDWICEVVSQGTEQFDRVSKMPVYAKGGVAFAWLVNPLTQTLEVYACEGERWTLLVVHGGDAPVRAVPFDAVELDLAALWGKR